MLEDDAILANNLLRDFEDEEEGHYSFYRLRKDYIAITVGKTVLVIKNGKDGMSVEVRMDDLDSETHCFGKVEVDYNSKEYQNALNVLKQGYEYVKDWEEGC